MKSQRRVREESGKSQRRVREESEKSQRRVREESGKSQRRVREESEKSPRSVREESEKRQRRVREESEKSQRRVRESARSVFENPCLYLRSSSPRTLANTLRTALCLSSLPLSFTCREEDATDALDALLRTEAVEAHRAEELLEGNVAEAVDTGALPIVEGLGGGY